VGIAQTVADAAGKSILCREGCDAALPNDFGEVFLSKVKDFSRS